MVSRFKKLIAVGVCATTLVCMSASMFAAGASHTIDCTTTKATSTFTYGSGGRLLELDLDYEQYHPGTGHTDTGNVYKYAQGSQYTITATKTNDVGYSMVKATSVASVGGTVYSTLNAEAD